MCRIAGIISNQSQNIDTMVKTMCDTMAHGGPDDKGLYFEEDLNICLGHRRLSILDLSSAGHQPMFSDDINLVITFNGEIYNFQDIKGELIKLNYTFHTQTDTEVILQAYAEWGTESFEKFSGMFAFGLLDKIKNIFYLVRDSMGIKPVYYHVSNNELFFSSETKALEQLNKFEENPDWKIYLLAFGHIPEPFTTLKNVFSLKKGTFLTVNLTDFKHQIATYKTFTFSETVNESTSEVLKEKVQKAVEMHMISDAPIGIFLSGGLDSSLITLLANDLENKNLKTISTFFNEAGFSERKYQKLISDKIGGNHQEFVITYEDFQKHFKNALKAMDQPSTDGINSWFINKAAHEAGLKAVLSGIGADEFFGGYPSFRRMKTVAILRKFKKLANWFSKFTKNEKYKRFVFLSISGPVGDYLFLRGMFSPETIANLLQIDESLVFSKLEELNKYHAVADYKNYANGNKASYLESNFYMQNQLLKDSDFMSMAHSIELRVPFLDQDLVAYAMKLSANTKYDSHKPAKYLLIDAFKDILPEAIWNRPKMGFSLPFQKWMVQSDLISLPKSCNKTAKILMTDFKQNKLHWSKAFALYHVFGKA